MEILSLTIHTFKDFFFMKCNEKHAIPKDKVFSDSSKRESGARDVISYKHPSIYYYFFYSKDTSVFLLSINKQTKKHKLNKNNPTTSKVA